MEYRKSYCNGQLKTRNDDSSQDKYIEGYFIVFRQETELWKGCYEEIEQGAIANSLRDNDIRCLFNHDTAVVLGRMGNGTLELREDHHGLWGRVKINPEDKQALDIYARVQRGDICGCSFGFNPIREETENRADGTVKWKIIEADTREVSICTFPAYPQTEIEARQQYAEQKDKENMKKRKTDLLAKLEGMKC